MKFCSTCGNQIADNAKFCGHCGCSIPEESVTTTAEPAVTEVADEGSAEYTSFAQADFSTVAVPAKKKNLKIIIIAAIAVVLVVGIVLTIILINNKKSKHSVNLEASFGNMVTALSKDTDIEEKVDSVTDYFGQTFSALKNGLKTQVKINISDETANLINNYIPKDAGINIDIKELSSTTLNMEVRPSNGNIQCTMSIDCNGQTLIDANAIMDMKAKTIYVGSPSLSDTYISIPLSKILDDRDIANSQVLNLYMSILSGEINASEFLPSESEINSLIDTYLGVIKPYLENDRETSTTIYVGNYSQQVTEGTMELTQTDLKNMALAVLEKAKDDSTIINIIEKMARFLSNNGFVSIPESEISNFSTQYSNGIAEAITELQSEYASEEVLFTLVRYIDSNKTIVGRRMISEGETILYHATATEGSNYASTLQVDDQTILTGSGTVVDGKKAGAYYFDLGRQSITLNIKDFSIDSNGINGSVIYYFEEDMLEDIIDNSFATTLLGSAKPGIELKFSSSSDSKGYELNLVAGDKVMLGVSLTTSTPTKSAISIPGNTTDYRNADQWAESIDREAFMKRIENSPFAFLVTAMTGVNRVESDAVVAYR